MPPKLAFQARVEWPSLATCNAVAFLAECQYVAKRNKCQPLSTIVLHRKGYINTLIKMK